MHSSPPSSNEPSAVKNREEILRAIHLLSLALSGQVKLPRPLSPQAQLNTQGVVRALQWTIGEINPIPLDLFLQEIEQLTQDPGFNPMHSVAE